MFALRCSTYAAPFRNRRPSEGSGRREGSYSNETTSCDTTLAENDYTLDKRRTRTKDRGRTQ